MSETREVLGVWTFEGFHAPRNKAHRTARAEFIRAYFGSSGRYTPSFIWRTEFFKIAETPGYGMTLHRFAANEHGGRRYYTWVKGCDVYGEAQSIQLAPVLEPENYRIDELPPQWLLLNIPKVDSGA